MWAAVTVTLLATFGGAAGGYLSGRARTLRVANERMYALKYSLRPSVGALQSSRLELERTGLGVQIGGRRHPWFIGGTSSPEARTEPNGA